MRYAVPALILAALIALLAIGLTRDPTRIPSPLIGKPAPAFSLPLAGGGTLTNAQLQGRPALVNFFASWCGPCLQEHPLLMELAAQGVNIIGVNYKDEPADAEAWLARHGNAWRAIARDLDGRVAIDWGVYGVPESFVIDAQGIIRFKQVGPLTREAWDRDIAPLLKP